MDNNKKEIVKLFLFYYLILFTLSFAILFLSVFIQRKTYLDEYKMQSIVHLRHQNGLIMNQFQTLRSDLLFLPHLNELLRYKEMSNEEDRILIEQEFLEFAKSKKVYDKIRYLDKSGMEIISIYSDNGDFDITPHEDLQNKNGRYYFQDTIKAGNNEIYISPFDLNIEFGQIEIPLKPMIRFGTPVFDENGNVKGIIILNYLGETIINIFEEATRDKPGKFSLINMDGYKLYDNNSEDEWGFMFPDRNDSKYSVTHKELWGEISSKDELQVVRDSELLTSMIITLFQQTDNFSFDRSWILINTISFEEMEINWRRIFKDIFYYLIIIIFGNGIIAFVLTKSIAQRNRYREALKFSAHYDSLTKLPNRILLAERASRVIMQSHRYNRLYALLFIDLDGFKEVNDTLGHEAGDFLLEEVGARLSNIVRSVDTVARYGGDEFVVFLTQIEKREDCILVAEKILISLSSDFNINGSDVKIGGSIGIAIGNPEDNDTLENLLNHADTAMYEVKYTGKNGYKIFEKENNSDDM